MALEADNKTNLTLTNMIASFRLRACQLTPLWACVYNTMCMQHYQSPIVVYSCSTNVCSTMLMKRLAYACGSIADTPSVSTRCTNTWGGGERGDKS